MNDIILSDNQKDALKEIGNICSGNAATALSQLVGKKVSIVVPDILFMPLENVPQVIGGSDKLVTGLVLRVLGDLPSTLLFVLTQKDAVSLTSLVTRKPVTDSSVMGDIERSALKEIGLVLASSYLSALSSFVGMGLVPAIPEIIVDMAGAIVDYILIELSCDSRFALLIKSEFQETTNSATGHFFLIPDPVALQIILKAIDRA